MSKFSFIAFAAALAVIVPQSAQAERMDRDIIRPNQRISYQPRFEGEARTRIRILGDGDGDIDCVLLDDNGNVHDSDRDSEDGCLLYATPAWSARFKLILTNNGRKSSVYTMDFERQ